MLAGNYTRSVFFARGSAAPSIYAQNYGIDHFYQSGHKLAYTMSTFVNLDFHMFSDDSK